MILLERLIVISTEVGALTLSNLQCSFYTFSITTTYFSSFVSGPLFGSFSVTGSKIMIAL